MIDPDEEAPWKPPRPDAVCAHHPETEAIVRCRSCDRDVCFGCFFPDHARCQRCIEEHPEAIALPVPFESPELGAIRGFFGTLGAAFRPHATAASFAIGESRFRPWLFAMLTFVPAAFVRGIIPYTHRLHFGSGGLVRVTPGSSSNDIVLDLARAGALSTFESGAQLLALGVCYVSLASSFGRPEAGRIATRTLGYRAFLLPFGGVLGILPMVLGWLGPRALSSLYPLLVFGAMPLVPFFIGLRRSVRITGRVDSTPGVMLAVVPWILYALAGLLAELALAPYVPNGETL